MKTQVPTVGQSPAEPLISPLDACAHRQGGRGPRHRTDTQSRSGDHATRHPAGWFLVPVRPGQ